MSAQFPLTGWTPNAVLANYRQIVFGSFIFALTAQETNRLSKLALQSQDKLPFNPGGAYIAPNSTLGERTIEITADVGTGLVGSGGGIITTANDLEAERSLLASLQAKGRQKLWVRPDRYIWAYLADFTHKFFQEGGAFRYASWTCKFTCDDPRYYSANVVTLNFNGGAAITNVANFTAVPSLLGNTRTYPIYTIIGSGVAPQVFASVGSNSVLVRFGLLTMAAGDRLVVACDPRPEVRATVARYTPNGGAAQNALKYVRPALDFGNILDASEFFPYVDPGTTPAANFAVGMSGGAGSYTASVSYSDTWI